MSGPSKRLASSYSTDGGLPKRSLYLILELKVGDFRELLLVEKAMLLRTALATRKLTRCAGYISRGS